MGGPGTAGAILPDDTIQGRGFVDGFIEGSRIAAIGGGNLLFYIFRRQIVQGVHIRQPGFGFTSQGIVFPEGGEIGTGGGDILLYVQIRTPQPVVVLNRLQVFGSILIQHHAGTDVVLIVILRKDRLPIQYGQD